MMLSFLATNHDFRNVNEGEILFRERQYFR